MTISKLIKNGLLEGMRKFGLTDRGKLTLNLAQSLLHLYNGPWLQTLWTSENLLFLCESTKGSCKLYNIHNPVISCTISGDCPTLPPPKTYDDYPLLATFGLFLLEFGNGEKYPVSKTRTGVFSPWLSLRKNFVETNKQNLTIYYKQAIDSCLNFRNLVDDEKDPDMELRIRNAILKNIVRPLECHLRTFSKDQVDALRPKNLCIELATPQVSNSSSLRVSNFSAPRGIGKRQFENPEFNNYQAPPLESSREQTENGDVSSNVESEGELNTAEGRFFGTFDTNTSEMQKSG